MDIHNGWLYVRRLAKICSGVYMTKKPLTEIQTAALRLAKAITVELQEIGEDLEVPVSILIEDLVPHQPFIVAQMWTEDRGLYKSVTEKTREVVLMHTKPQPILH